MPRPRSTRTRKPAYELTIADLDEHPLWEFCLDEAGEPGQDESTMRPLAARGPVSPTTFDGWVATDFVTPSGVAYPGILSPAASPKDLWSSDPEIFLDKPAGKLVRDPLLKEWNQIINSDAARIGLVLAQTRNFSDSQAKPLIALAYRALRVRPGEYFPLTARPRVRIRGWPAEVRIDGFLRPPRAGRSRVLA